MNMPADFDTFAAELLDQIETVQMLSRALATGAAVREPPLGCGSDARKPVVEAGEQSSPSHLAVRPKRNTIVVTV